MQNIHHYNFYFHLVKWFISCTIMLNNSGQYRSNHMTTKLENTHVQQQSNVDISQQKVDTWLSDDQAPRPLTFLSIVISQQVAAERAT